MPAERRWLETFLSRRNEVSLAVIAAGQRQTLSDCLASHQLAFEFSAELNNSVARVAAARCKLSVWRDNPRKHANKCPKRQTRNGAVIGFDFCPRLPLAALNLANFILHAHLHAYFY